MRNRDSISKEIKDIVDLAKENGILELNLEIGDLKLHLKFKEGEVLEENINKKPSLPANNIEQNATETKSNVFLVKSPLVGTFYRKPNPNAKPFVEVGDIVEKGQTLCIVETMKIMNEIIAERKGKITKILVEDGAMVEVETPLFEIEEIYED
ncbi:acetyl-CoA carboxylase biotin carboxyl carrier protein [Caldisericum exile]|uniref:Biotin carboxyl carrier protein of acetyl-CoA carboxylase n=1 Tax=Caldisericum exile (strain DSM 21853 / NBRC 104410 / AZM16c01) TaxID=511051 RepID=A0A7U6JH77_CALEA|nr:acetyl-CoA carboxylase biotin carboxyl carrier protein [Caldisericum exile]BAL81622.1 acetyl-CoA carboxylase biotin carboxyl carrier protein [Caldisericum exile AZM16c01]